MDSALELAIVRVFKSGKKIAIAGSGFFVSSQYILTCAHVVAYAASLSDKQEEQPTQIIEIDFPVVEMGRKIETTVEFWYPRKASENIQDIAVLKLIDSNLVPKGAEPINLISARNENLWDHNFRALGFPEKGSNGEWATGKLRGRVGKGRVQLEDIKEAGLRLEKGFSGTPIWDETLQGVVGMAVTADQERPEAKVAFMTPTDVLLQVGDLASACKVNGRVQEAIAIIQDDFETRNKEIRCAYYQSLPDITIPMSSGQSLSEFPGSIAEMIRNLDHYDLLETFIGYLFLHLQDLGRASDLCQKLEEWLTRHIKDNQNFLKELRKKLALKNQQKTEAGEKAPCILIGVFEKSSSFVVRAWLIEDTRNYTPQIPEGCHLLTNEEDLLINEKGIVINHNNSSEDQQPKNITELLQVFFADANSRCESQVKTLQIFLPYKIIDKDIKSIEQWSVDPNIPKHFQTQFGSECEVAVRFSERLKISNNLDQYVKKSRAKWQILDSKRGQQGIQILHPLGMSSPGKLFRQINPDQVVAVKLIEKLQASKRESILETFYYAGIPLALWIRPEAETCNCCGTVDDVCQTCSCWSKLPETIKTTRYEAWEEEDETHIGNHLSLLWDDPNLVPPANQLGMLAS